MTAYKYYALDKQGKHLSGNIESDSEKMAREQLRVMGLTPLQLQLMTEKTLNQPHQFSHLMKRKKLHLSELASLTRQFATLLQAGLPVAEALAATSTQFEKDTVKGLILAVRTQVLEGQSLVSALKLFPNIFPPLYTATVQAGEQSGHLDKALERLADHIEQQHEIRQKLQHAFIYPSVMLTISLAIVAFLLAYVVPKIIGVFQDTGQALPALTQGLLYISHIIQHYGIYAIMTLLMFIIVFKKALKSDTFRYRWHSYLLKVPLLRKMIATVDTARFTGTFGILISAGVNILESMQLSASLVSCLPIKAKILQSITQVQEGSSLSQALKQVGYFNVMTLQLLASGENSGRLEEMAQRAATSQEKKMLNTINTGLSLLEPFIIVVMGAIVLFIVLAILLPIFEMNQMIG